MFEDRKTNKKMERLFKEAMEQGLNDIGDHVKTDTNEVVAGNERILGDDPVLITGPKGVESGEFSPTDWGWLVLTDKRLNFQRMDGDRVRVAFITDLTLDSSDGPFDSFNWQDRAQLRRISFGYLKKNSLRDQVHALLK